MTLILGKAIFLVPVVGVWLILSYIIYRIGRKFGVGSFLTYCVPVYNVVLLCRCGNISPWNTLGLAVPIVSIYFVIHIWGSIAQRLGKSYWVYGILSLIFPVTVLIMAFDGSLPSELLTLDVENGVRDMTEESEEPARAQNEMKMKSGFFSNFDVLNRIGLKSVNELMGVDIGSTSIKVCVLKRAKDGLRIHHIVKKHYKEELLSDGNIVDPVFIAQELKKIIVESQIKTKAVACALSSYTIITKKIVAPFVEEDELENTIRLEVEAVIPFPLKDIYHSYYVLGVDPDQEDMMHVQIVAAKKEIVDGYIDTFNLAGLNLQILDVDILGVMNMVEQIYNPQGSSVVAVDIGASVTNIAIMKAERLEFTREILMGGKYLTNQIERSTKLSHVEAENKKISADSDVAYLFEDFIFNISSEITKTINFYTASKPNDIIGKIYLTGGSSLLQGLKEKIEEDTRVEVEYINPFMLLNMDEASLHAYEEHNAFMVTALYLSSRVTDLGQ
jgi:type IV pilus assembly protein PilM